jgi:hypothetical protein
MTPVRRPRLFHDHKAPLAAFVLVVLTSMFMMVHIARSEAAPSWLRNGVSTIAAGPVLVQRVITGDLVEPAPEPADPPAEITAAGQPVEAPSASSEPRTPDASSTHGPSLGGKQEPGRVPDHAGHVGHPVVGVEPPETPTPSETPSTPPASGGKDQGHGLTWGQGHDDSDQAGSSSDDSEDSSGDSDAPSWGSHGGGHAWGHGNDDNSDDDSDDDHGWGGGGHGWGHGNDDDDDSDSQDSGWGGGHGWGHDDDDDHGSSHGGSSGSSGWGHGGGWGHHR